MLARPARIDLSSQPCRARPASKRCSRWYSWRARLFSAIVPPDAAFPLSLPPLLSLFFAIAALSQMPRTGHRESGCHRTVASFLVPRGQPLAFAHAQTMPTIRRSALVEHSAARMFALVNDVAAYPRRFDWCERRTGASKQDETRMVARLDLGLGALQDLVHHREHADVRRTTST